MPSDETTVGTRRRAAILKYVTDYWTAHGYSPTVREIGGAVGLTSLSAVCYELDILMARGLLLRDFGVSRSIRLVQP